MSAASGVVISPGAENWINKGKRRKMKLTTWKDTLRKKARDAGNPYISKRNKPVPGKLPPEMGRQCNCRFQCGKLTQEEILKNFKDFYQMTYNNQTAFLAQSCIKVVDITRHTVSENIFKRHCTVEYYLPRINENIRICQKTICHVFKITPRRIQMLEDKIKFNKPLEDCRGSHGKHKKVAEETKELIKQHIESFPCQESQYSRRDSQTKCLDPALTVSKMWELFLIQHPDSDVNLHLYRDIFNSDFNLRFGLPRSDTCAYCDRLFIQLVDSRNENERKKIEIESKVHHIRPDAAYKALDKDKSDAEQNPNDIVLCVDLQQVLFCPNLTHNNVFYQRQLSCYNLAIHDMGNNQACMFLWNETVGKRGSAEIASCILKYIELNFQKLKPGETRTLKFWSDRCIGQNSNWRLISVMQHLVTNKLFTTVEQKFMTTGHSFLPYDRDFALIEKSKKGKTVYVPFQWVEIIAHANTKHPFNVCVMETEDFKNTDIVLNAFATSKFNITGHVWYQLTADDPSTLRGRTSHNVLQPWNAHILAKIIKERENPSTSNPGTSEKKRTFKEILPKKGAKKKEVNRYPPVVVDRFPRLYEGALPIKAAKKKDLLNMCKYSPQEYVPFYENIAVE